MRKHLLSIGQISRNVGVPVSTIRYYERIQLLHPDGRTGGNYRIYGNTALERLRFIKAAQENGFTLDDITELLNFQDGAIRPCKNVQKLIQVRLADIHKRMEQMRKIEAVLRFSLKICRQFERTGRCKVIDTLKHATTSPAKKAVLRRVAK